MCGIVREKRARYTKKKIDLETYMCVQYSLKTHTQNNKQQREKFLLYIFTIYVQKFSFLLSSSQDTSTKILTENTNRMIRSVFQILIFSGSLIGVHCFNDFLVMGDWGGPIWPYEDPAETGIASMNAIA